MALLITKSPGEADREFSLEAEETIIGRGSEAAIRLDGANISRRHARVSHRGNDYFIEDLGSSNGTFVNGRRIPGKTTLSANDVLRIGSYTLRFQRQYDPDLTVQRRTVASHENDELYLQNVARRLKAVLQLAHDLGNTLEVEVLLKRFLDQIQVLFPNTDRAIVIFIENDQPLVRMSRDLRTAPGKEPLFSRSLLKQISRDGIGVLAEDTSQLDAQMTLQAAGVRSMLCVPLRAQGTAVFGAIQLDRFRLDHPYTADDLHLLTAVTIQVALTLEKARMHEQLLVQERMARELALAREVQLAFLPQSMPKMACGEIDLFAELEPAQEVSGDFYDMIPLDGQRVALLVADVSGKGMAAALFMSMVRALIRQVAVPEIGPAEALRRLNEKLVHDNPKFMFVTIVLCFYDVPSGECRISRAGHPAPLHLEANRSARELESSSGCLLGVCEEVEMKEERLLLKPGELLVFYSDGVTEAVCANHREMFGTGRLLQSIKSVSPEASLKEYAVSLRRDVQQFCAPGRPEDDVTLLFLRR